MGSFCGGSNTTTTKGDPTLMKYYQEAVGRAQKTANTPYKPYQGQMVAPLSGLEKQAARGVTAASQAYQPYFQQASQYAQQAAQKVTPQAWSRDALQQYMDPYQQQVIDATMANINETNAQQQQGVVGNAITKGAWGGDRAGIAQAELARQQGLANNATLAGLNSQNYQQAQQQFNTQQGVQMSAAQLNAQNAANAGYTFGNLGVASQQAALSGVNAQAQMGAQGRAVQQAKDQANYQQYLNKQAYPFQSTQFLSNIVEGIGGNAGSSTTGPSPNPLAQIGGAALGFAGMFAKRGGRIGYASGGAPLAYGYDDQPFDSFDTGVGATSDWNGVPYTPEAKALNADEAFTAVGAKNSGGHHPNGIAPYTGAGADDLTKGHMGNDVLAGISAPMAPPPSGGLKGSGSDDTLSGSAPPVPAGATKSDKGWLGVSHDKWRDLSALGFGMAASQSPFLGVAIGQGGQSMMDRQSQRRDFELRKQQADAEQAYRTGSLGIQQRSADNEANRLLMEGQHWDKEYGLNQQKARATRYDRQMLPGGASMVIDTWDPDAPPRIIPMSRPPAGGAPPGDAGTPPGTPPAAAQPADPFASVTEPPANIGVDSAFDPLTMSKMGQAETQASTIDTMKEAKATFTASVGQEGLINDMERDAEALPDEGLFAQGAFAGQRLAAGKALSGVARIFGLDPSEFGLNPDQIAAGEDMFKNATRLGFQLAKTLGSREAMQIVQQAIGAVPGMENTPLGFKRIVAGLRATIDYNKDYYVAAQKYQKATGGSLNGFDDWFAKANPPAKYAARELLKTAKHPVTPDAIKFLQTHPDQGAAFDETYGGGLSEVVLQALKP